MNKFFKIVSNGIMLSCFVGTLQAQELTNIKSRLINDFNQPIQGAMILIDGGKLQLMTNKDGHFNIPTESVDAEVEIFADGYQNLRIKANELKNNGELKLSFDPHHIGGRVNFGYSSYNKESVTGAFSRVSGTDLDKTPSNVLSDTYEGRLPGLTVSNNIAEFTFFGYGNYSKSIRGNSSVNGNSPLVIIDGVIAPTQYLEFISPKEIDDITVLKDASSTAAYGIQGSAGVIVLTTKRGNNDQMAVEAYVDQTFQQMTRKPLFITSNQYAELRNEAGEADGAGKYSQFTQEEIDLFKAGNDPRYPNNNWYQMYMKDVVLRQRVGVNVSGGTEKFKYYSNLSFINQGQPFKITDEADRKYDPTPYVNIGNFRTNMDVKFNKYLSGYMRLAGNVKREILAGGNMGWNIYGQLLNQPSTMYGPLSPALEDNTELSNQVVTIDGLDNPVYGMLNRSGYRTVIETNVIAQTGLKLDMDFLTKGLSMSGGMAYQTYVRNETGTSQSYMRVLRDEDYSKLDQFSQYKAFENTPLSYNKGSTFFYYLNLLARVDYSRRFGEHSIDASAHTYYLKQEKEAVGTANSVLPYKRQNFGLTALYGYRNRYFLKADMAYSGSEQFHPDHRYILTPAVSASWIASRESFFESDLITLLKLRASYGINGNDQLGDSRFLYLDNIRSDGSELAIGNPKLEAEKIKKTNLGLDLGFYNMFTIGFDYFANKVNNMLINSSSLIPDYQGVPLSNYPKLNGGKMENKGYELSLIFDKNFSKDLHISAQLNFMQAKNKVIDIKESPLGDDYTYPYRTQGYAMGQLWGYQVDQSNGNGMFNSLEELKNLGLTYSFGQPRVGDLIYKDLNNDKIINEKDIAPLGYSRLPQQEYSVLGGITYKNFEFSFLLHGVGKSSLMLSGIGAYENQGKGIFNDIHLNAWTPERYANGEQISSPALSLSPSTNHVANDYYLNNRSYLRLRNVEVAYHLPHPVAGKIGSENIRIALSCQNLFTIDHMKTDYIDPEIGSMGTFQPFRVYNIGISAKF